MKSELTGRYSSFFQLDQREIQIIVEGLELLIVKELKGKKIEHTIKLFQASRIKDAFETALDNMILNQIQESRLIKEDEK